MASELQALNESPVTDEAVRWAYRLILGREPESAEVVAEQRHMNASLASLRRGFLNSPEFLDSLPSGPRIALQGFEPPCQIDCQGSPEELNRLFERVNRSWHALGEEDPFYSVLTQPEFRGVPREESIRNFFLSGHGDVERFMKSLHRNGLDVSNRPVCLEFGCGLGRITRALAPHFQSTIGVDISAPHLVQAEKYAREAGVSDIQWTHLNSVASLDALPKVDVIYSIIVLQHNPPPVIDKIIATFARILNPGGIAYFQVPTYRKGYEFDLREYLNGTTGNPGMEMHVYPQQRIFEHFGRANAAPVSVVEDDATGMSAYERSNTFIFVRHEP